MDNPSDLVGSRHSLFLLSNLRELSPPNPYPYTCTSGQHRHDNQALAANCMYCATSSVKLGSRQPAQELASGADEGTERFGRSMQRLLKYRGLVQHPVSGRFRTSAPNPTNAARPNKYSTRLRAE